MKKNKLILGVGVNDSDYVLNKWIWIDGKLKVTWTCPFYLRWRNMLVRCYCPKFQNKRKSYSGCFVCNEWLTFSNFKQWMEQQDWEGKQLDKDLLVPGNKVYSPETCMFISNTLNVFLADSSASRGHWPLGVYWKKETNKFVAQVTVNNKQKHLGVFDTSEEAHEAWRQAKYEMAVKLAAEQPDDRVSKALLARYSK